MTEQKPSEGRARYMTPEAKEAARERERQAGAKFAPTPKGKTRDRIGKMVGVSGWTLSKMNAVVEAAERAPETYGDLVEMMDYTGKVDRAYREFRRRRHIIMMAAIRAGMQAEKDAQKGTEGHDASEARTG